MLGLRRLHALWRRLSLLRPCSYPFTIFLFSIAALLLHRGFFSSADAMRRPLSDRLQQLLGRHGASELQLLRSAGRGETLLSWLAGASPIATK